jgi:hypothetical protein
MKQARLLEVVGGPANGVPRMGTQRADTEVRAPVARVLVPGRVGSWMSAQRGDKPGGSSPRTRPFCPHPDPLPQSPGLCSPDVVLWEREHARGGAAAGSRTGGRWFLVGGPAGDGAGSRRGWPTGTVFRGGIRSGAHTEVRPPAALVVGPVDGCFGRGGPGGCWSRSGRGRN